MTAGWRRGVVGALVCIILVGCGGGTEPSLPTEITFNRTALSFFAFGQTEQLTPVVTDQHGNAMRDVEITWQSVNNAVATVSVGGLVTAAGKGSTQVMATVGGATGTVQVNVQQTVAQLEKVLGDLQQNQSGSALLQPLTVEARDAFNNPVVGATIDFAAVQGGGALTTPTVVTGANGRASAAFTLGPKSGEQRVTATVSETAVAVTFLAFAQTGPAAQITVYRGNNRVTAPGATVVPVVKVADALGNGVADAQVSFQITAGGGTVGESSTTFSTSTDGSGLASAGWVLGGAGQHRLTATVNGMSLAGNPVTFVATATTDAISPYNIEIRFLWPPTAGQAQAFAEAELRWERLLVGELANVPLSDTEVCAPGMPDVDENIDDLLILVDLLPIDGPGDILGSAGPCYLRGDTHLPILGIMQFDTEDFAFMESEGILRDVILHEIGHVLGVGTLWEFEGLLIGPKRTGGTDPHFIGPQAIAAFDAAGGAGYVAGQKVPVENTGGSGTIDSHWRESVLDHELMTGFANLGANPLSVVTLRSLQDLGYTVDMSGVDPFSLASAFRLPRRGPPVLLKDDVRRGIIRRVDRQGRVTGSFMR